jgi:hypothetical protein
MFDGNTWKGQPPVNKLRLAITLAAFFVASAIAWWGTTAWSLLPFGSTVFLHWSLVFGLFFFLAVAVLPLSLLIAIFRRFRRGALKLAAACAAILIGLYGGGTVGNLMRAKRMEGLPGRAAPLIAAIRAYERENQHPPKTLEELVPRHIAALPSTGFGGHREWSYVVGPFTGSPNAERYGANAWALSVYVVTRPVGSHQFLYLPDQRYPSPSIRYGDWVRLYY